MNLRKALAALLAAAGFVAAVPQPALADGIPGGFRTYTISVKTGDLDGAGTDSWVQIRMHGTRGETTDWIVLDDERDNHERGRLDRYTVKHVDIGELEAIDVWCDHSGDRADWFLDWILISKSSTDSNLFSYGGWFTKNQIVGIENWTH